MRIKKRSCTYDRSKSWSIPVMMLFIALSPLLQAQTVQGDLVGTVHDPTGAVVPGASVKIINETTGGERDVLTDDNGDYRSNGFFLGSYRVEVTKTGFGKATVSGVQIEPVTVKRADVTLSVATTTSAMNVEDTGAVVQNEGTTLINTLPRVALDRPVSDTTRSDWALNQLMWTPGSSSSKGGFFIFAGTRGSQEDMNMEGAQQSVSLFVPSTGMEALTVISGAAPAEYARATTINITFKSGTNDLHADYLVSLSNPAINAIHTPFFQGRQPVGISSWRHNFGVGGPVYIPHLYNGKNKTFFYFNLSRPQPVPSIQDISQSIPTSAMRAGDYSQYPIKPIDPLTGIPFPNAIIPSSRISPTANAIMADLYKGYRYTGSPDAFVNNSILTFNSLSDTKRWVLKVDENLGSKNFASFTWESQKSINNQSNAVPGVTPQSWNEQVLSSTPQNRWIFGDTHIFSPSIVNQLRFSVSRLLSTTTAISSNTDSSPVLGAAVLSRWGIQGLPPNTQSGYPQLNINNWQTGAVVGAGSWDTRYQLSENLTYVRGRHAIKGGFSFLKLLQDSISNPGFGSFTFDGRLTKEPFADFLLGLPDTYSQTSIRPTIALRGFEVGAYLQDDWRVNSKLTLSYGVRWDRYAAPYDKSGLYFTFDPATGKIVVPNSLALANVSPAFPSSKIPVVLGSSLGYPTKLTNPNARFLPRIGFAYRPSSNNSLVVRAGFGIYNANRRFGGVQSGGPFSVTQSYINGQSNSALQSWPNIFQSGSGSTSATTGSSVSTNFRPDYAETWNLTVEKAFRQDWGVRVSYIGTVGKQLALQYNVNSPIASTTALSQATRPYPNFQDIIRIENGGFDAYNALQIIVSHPFKNGLYFQAGYTEQRDTTDVNTGSQFETIPGGSIDYAYNRTRDTGPSSLWPHHDFVTDVVYELPVGRHRRFLSDLSNLGAAAPVVHAIVGGWSFTGVYTWHSGNFFTPTYTGFDPANLGQFTGRPNVVPGCQIYTGQAWSSTNPFINNSCFTIPAPGTLGNAGVDSLLGPSQWVVNLNPFKDFTLTRNEKLKMRLGADIYNILNHPIYGAPTGIVNSPSGGLLTDGVFVRRGTEGNRNRSFIVSAKITF